MLKVSLPQSVTVKPDDLAALVRILGVPVQVEPVDAAAPVAKVGAKKAAAPRAGGNIDPATGKRKYKPRQPKAVAAPEAGIPGNEIPGASSSTDAGSAGDPPPPADAAPVKVEKAATPAKAKPTTAAGVAAKAKEATKVEKTKAAPKAEKAAKPAKAAPAAPAEAVDKDEVLARFGALIDKDYDLAAKLLEEFGATSFSSLKDAELGAFSAKLEEHGV